MTLLPHHWYFLILKSLVLVKLGLEYMKWKIAENPFFEFVEFALRVSLGVYLGVYFWIFPPAHIPFEDALIISVGGFIILTDTKFEPLMQAYKIRDNAIAYTEKSVL